VLAITALGVSAAPALAAADKTPPAVTLTTTPPLPAGQNGFFNAHDFDAAGGKITVNVSASDPSGVTNIKCLKEGDDFVADQSVDHQSGTNPRTGSFTANSGAKQHYSCYAKDGASPPNTGEGQLTVLVDRDAPSAATSALGVFQRQHSVRVKWSGRDPGQDVSAAAASKVRNFDVRQREADADTRAFGAFREFDSPFDQFADRPSPTSRVIHGDAGDTLCFSTQAIDGARNLSGYTKERCTAIPLDDVAFTQFGGWTRIHHSGYYSGTLTQSSTIGSKLVSPVVSGTRLALLVSTGPSSGTIRTRWHGHTKTISLRSAHTKNRKVIVLHGYTGRGQLLVRVVGRGVSAIDGLGVWKRP
jgi:hypothetical protein